MSRTGTLSAFLASCLALTSCAGSDEPPVLDFSGFDAAIEQLLVDEGLEGATAAIVHRDWGIVHARAYGSFALDRVSLIASASKVASAGVLVRLADQGLIDLDAPLSDYIADWPGSRDFTLAQMLSNSSGLVGLIDNPTYPPYICQYSTIGTIQSCARQIYGADDAEDIIPPDTRFRYGGGQWQLAGGIAELVSGKTWDELLQETYGDTCGVTTLGYGNHYQQAFLEGGVNAAFSYPTFFQGDPANLTSTRNPNIEGGGYVTVTDYAEILWMHLRRGRCGNGRRALSAHGVARMREDRIGEAYDGSTTFDPTLPGYGLGWWLSRDEPGVVADVGAYGATPYLDVERGYGVIIIVESRADRLPSLRLLTQPLVEEAFDAAE